jgi:hemerythrin-like domain-containing protein
MVTTAQPGQKPDVNEMLVIHRVFRREFVALPTLIRGVADGDTARAAMVADHLRLVLGGLHMHHTGEDELLWPLLLERAAPSTGLVETMQAQHHRVDEYADQVDPLVSEWRSNGSAVRGEQLARVLEQFARALFEHLDLEEREILPLVSRYVTVKEWDSLGEHGKESMSAKQLPLLFGAILEDATDDERSRMLAHLPAPIRLVMRTIGARQYRRYITRVRAA